MSLTPQNVKLAFFLGGLALFFAVETIVATRPWRSPRGNRLALHAGLAVFNTVLINLTMAGPLAWLALTVGERGWGLSPLLGLGGVAEILASVVVLDLFDYVWHRANHQSRFLWRFHSVHHVDTHLDVTTSLRFHPGELLLSGGAKALWILIWGPSIWAFAIFEIMVSLSAQYHHSNIDFPDRVEAAVRVLNVTPRMHVAHHSALTKSLDANFSTVFSVWDRLFGSYMPPSPEHLVEQGLRYGRDRDLDPAFVLTMPFRRQAAARSEPAN